MNFTVRDDGGVRNIALMGQLTFAATENFREVIAGLERDKVKACALDLGGLDFIDSAGLGLLVLAHAGATHARIDFKITHPKGQVREMIEVAEFHTVIPCEF